METDKFSYSKYYKEKIKRDFPEKPEEEKKAEGVEEAEKSAEKAIEEVEEKIGKVYEESGEFVKQPNYIKILKILVLLVPLIIIFYLIFANFIISQEFNYFYDIGSKQDIKKPYLTPAGRVSDVVSDEDINYRNFTGQLVYFNVPIPKGSETIKVQARFKDNFPENSIMSLGAKDQEVWHYNYHSIYTPALNYLSEFPKKENVYLINPDKYLIPPEELAYERDAVVAVDKPYAPISNIVSDYIEKETVINTSLRGKHIFYIYASGDLEVNVKKQDINWYSGSDDLEIALYDLENNLVANLTIEDDGITEVKNKETSKIQEGILNAESLKEGVYKLEFGDFDGLIREIKINTNKIVAESVFLADNSLYNVETKSSRLYFKSFRAGQIRLMTYHSQGLQNITYNRKKFDFNQEDEPLYMNVGVGEYEISFPKNDLIVSGAGYFAFSEENYFEPFKQKVVKIQNDFDWIKNNVDYLVSDYKKPAEDNGWLIAETEFNIKEDNLFIKNNELNFVFNIPHLGNEQYPNYTIPVEWINITVYKPGII